MDPKGSPQPHSLMWQVSSCPHPRRPALSLPAPARPSWAERLQNGHTQMPALACCIQGRDTGAPHQRPSRPPLDPASPAALPHPREEQDVVRGLWVLLAPGGSPQPGPSVLSMEKETRALHCGQAAPHPWSTRARGHQ